MSLRDQQPLSLLDARLLAVRLPMRWLIVFLLAFVLFNGLAAWLRRIGLGRLPGDFTLRWRGREFHVPLASSVLLSVLVMLVSAFF